jgi:omega-amidase
MLKRTSLFRSNFPSNTLNKYKSLIYKKNMSSNIQLKTKARIGLCQIPVGADKLINITSAENALLDAINKAKLIPKIEGGNNKLDIAVLPEIWNSPYSTSQFSLYAESIPEVGQLPNNDSPSISFLIQQAKLHDIWLIGGSIPERNGDKLYNTCVVVNPNGDIVGKHRKVHLFDIDIPGKMTFQESATLSAGDNVTVVDSPWGSIGIGICYDLRFPELARYLSIYLTSISI